MNDPRILSLLPAATEIVYLLGLEKYLVGVSDDCDYPSQVKKLPKVTECLIDQNLTSQQIDQKVKTLQHQGINVSHLDENLLRDLKPNLILTQDICSVCAVSYTQVQKAARILEGEARIISLEPESVGDILDNILLIGESANRVFVARKPITHLKTRIKELEARIEKTSKRPKVLVIEWLDPVMVAGHWVPEMVEKAGGQMLITKPGEKSFIIDLKQFKINLDILIISPCGFDIQRILKERKAIRRIVQDIKGLQGIFIIDGNSYMTRPGPRIIDGIEILAEIIHPEIFPRIYTNKDWMEFK